MLRQKKSKTFNCVIQNKFNNEYNIGNCIKVKTGYAKYLERNGYVIIVDRKSDIKSVTDKKVFSQMQGEINKLSVIKNFTIERKTKRNSSEYLFQKISTDNIINTLCKQNLIKYFSCFKLYIDNSEEQEIKQTGKYQCSIYCNENKLTTIKLLIIGISTSFNKNEKK